MKTVTPSISQLRMLASIRNQAWMIRPDLISEYALSALEVPEKKSEFDLADYYPMRNEAHVDQNGIGHVDIRGALLNQSPRIYEKLGLATTYATIIKETESVISSGAKGVLFHINSPGGTVAGNVEAANFIQNLSIPTAAHCEGMACSAAYKLAAGAEAIFATESAEVGNIGTIMSWADCSEMWKEVGVEFKALVNDGADLKSTFHLEPDEKQIEFLQESINEAGADFRSHVESNRPGINAEVFRAGWYHGEKAGSLGLIDGVTTAQEAAEWIQGILTQPKS